MYSQSNKETVEQYGCNFRAFCDAVEAFLGSPGVHKGMIEAFLKDPRQVARMGNPTDAKKKKA